MVGHDNGDVGVCTGSGEKDSEVANFGVGVEADYRETDYGHDGIEGDGGAAHVVFVTPPARCYHLLRERS